MLTNGMKTMQTREEENRGSTKQRTHIRARKHERKESMKT